MTDHNEQPAVQPVITEEHIVEAADAIVEALEPLGADKSLWKNSAVAIVRGYLKRRFLGDSNAQKDIFKEITGVGVPTPTSLSVGMHRTAANSQDEIAWLVETQIKNRPTYITMQYGLFDDYSYDANIAIRFSRKIDAEKVARAMNKLCNQERGWYAAEHSWSAEIIARPAPAQSTEVEEFIEEVSRIAAFLVGYGDAADLAARRLRAAIAAVREKGEKL